MFPHWMRRNVVKMWCDVLVFRKIVFEEPHSSHTLVAQLAGIWSCLVLQNFLFLYHKFRSTYFIHGPVSTCVLIVGFWNSLFSKTLGTSCIRVFMLLFIFIIVHIVRCISFAWCLLDVTDSLFVSDLFDLVVVVLVALFSKITGINFSIVLIGVWIVSGCILIVGA